MREAERLEALAAIADLSRWTERAKQAARVYSDANRARGAQRRFWRMRGQAEASYLRFRREARA